MARDGIFFFRSFYDVGRKMSAKDRQAYYDAILGYAFDDITPRIKGVAEIGFISAKPILDADKNKYLNGQKAAGFGKLGGRPTKEKNPQGFENENPQGLEEKTPNKNKNIKQEQENITPVAPLEGETVTKKRFVKPPRQAVALYAKSMGYEGFSADAFCDFYDSKGWKVGSEGMKDWKAAVRNWQRNQKNFKPSADYVSRTVIPDREVFKYEQGTI